MEPAGLLGAVADRLYNDSHSGTIILLFISR